MILLVLYSSLFAAATAASVVLTGNRQLLSGNLTSLSGMLELAVNWRFVLAMLLSVVTRYLFVVINSTAYAIPHLSNSATTVTAVIGALSYPVILLANFIFLHERLSMRQSIAASLIVIGILLASTRSD